MVANKAGRLVEQILGRRLPISYLTVFAHTPEEYAQLVEFAGKLGQSSEANNGEKFELAEPLQTNTAKYGACASAGQMSTVRRSAVQTSASRTTKRSRQRSLPGTQILCALSSGRTTK